MKLEQTVNMIFFYILQAGQAKAGKSCSQFIERSRELRKSNVASHKIVWNEIVQCVKYCLEFGLFTHTTHVFSFSNPFSTGRVQI